jgi:hypothetical protein
MLQDRLVKEMRLAGIDSLSNSRSIRPLEPFPERRWSRRPEDAVLIGVMRQRTSVALRRRGIRVQTA